MSDYISRTMEKTVDKMKKSFPVIMITGPRQVGKTTLLSMMAEKDKNEKINFISLDDLNARTLAIEDPELFLRTYEMPLIIDEFQYAPNLLSYIKIIVDKKWNTLIGVHMMGNYSSEIILAAATMVESNMNIEEIKKVVFPHPSVGEIIREAIFSI